MKSGVLTHVAFAVWSVFLLCGSANASENYSLTVGDGVRIVLHGQDSVWDAQVDLDGMLRLPELGNISVEGLSLDQAEDFLEETITSEGIFVAPRVSIAVTNYAPLTVSGAVRAPGTFDYSATMTVEAAVGLAGGLQFDEGNQTNLHLNARQLMGDLSVVETDIQSTAVRFARVEAELEESAEIELDLSSMLPIARIDREFVETIVQREAAILEDLAKTDDEMIRLRELELEETEREIALLLDRRKIQGELIILEERERNVAEQMRQRGLSTRTAVAALERVELNNQARLLEIEASLSRTRARRADISRAITQYKHQRNIDLLETSNRLREELEILISNRSTLIEKGFLLGDALGTALVAAKSRAPVYEIRRRQNGEVRSINLPADARVQPGDVILVKVDTSFATE